MSNTTRNPGPAQTQRRGLFRRAAFAALIGGITAGIGTKAFAHGGWQRGGFMASPIDSAQLEERLERVLRHLYVEIDATGEQQRQLGPIVKQAVRDLLPIRGQMREARKKALDLLSGEHVDRAAIESLRAEHLQLAEQASKRIAQTLADAAEVLSPAQRRDLAARIERHRRGWL